MVQIRTLAVSTTALKAPTANCAGGKQAVAIEAAFKTCDTIPRMGTTRFFNAGAVGPAGVPPVTVAVECGSPDDPSVAAGGESRLPRDLS